MRVGFSWSGRRDAWLNRHKSVPFETIFELVKNNPQYEWINLQVDATPEESHRRWQQSELHATLALYRVLLTLLR
jgi:hypothetical protein